MARRIYEEWFVRFRFPGHEGVRMVESELGLVPEGWEVRALDEIASFRRAMRSSGRLFRMAMRRCAIAQINALRPGCSI
jgi:hypothetical protein